MQWSFPFSSRRSSVREWARTAPPESSISPALRSSSRARNATACSTRVSWCTSVSKSKRVRRASGALNRPRNCSTGGKRSSRCASETAGGSAVSARRTVASSAGSGGPGGARSSAQAGRPEPEVAVALLVEPVDRRSSLLDAAVLREPAGSAAASAGSDPRDRSLAGEQRVPSAPAAPPPGRGTLRRHRGRAPPARPDVRGSEHDARNVHLAQVELVPQDEREQQVEGTLERLEVELELANRRHYPPDANGEVGRGPSGSPSPARPSVPRVPLARSRRGRRGRPRSSCQ